MNKYPIIGFSAIRDPLGIFGESNYYQDKGGTNSEDEEYTFLDSQADLNISKFYRETQEETADISSHKSIEKKIGRNEICVHAEVGKV